MKASKRTSQVMAFTALLVLLISQRAIAQATDEGSQARVVRGDLLHLVCATTVNVRNDDLKTIAFRADGFERVKPFQGWGENKKTGTVRGQEFTFVRVQFYDSENRGHAIGWVAEQFVKLKSDCPAGALREVSLANDPLRDISGLDDSKCCLFPLEQKASRSYQAGGAQFGAGREGGARLHAAVDLFAGLHDEVRSVAPGKIVRGPIHFYLGTYEVTVRHKGGFVARYGEISPEPGRRGRGIESGATVKTGQTIGKVGQCINQDGSKFAPPMLHFELYTGKLSDSVQLTSRGSGRGRFWRRSDLINPTSHIEKWERASL